MGLYLLGLIFSMLGIRGHISRFDGSSAPRTHPSLAADSALARALLAFIGIAAFVTLTLWVAVWLALKLL